MSDLQDAIDRLERVDANLAKLRDVWRRIRATYPEGIALGQDDEDVDDLLERFQAIQSQLPPIDGYRLEATPLTPDQVGATRLEVADLGISEATTSAEEAVELPGRQIATYERRVRDLRRRLVRDPILDVRAKIDTLLRSVKTDVPGHTAAWTDGDRWSDLSALVQELDPLVTELDLPAGSRRGDLKRHIRFAEPHDLLDIVSEDWPTLRSAIDHVIYADDEPLPIPDEDLADVVRRRPTGAVSRQLDWSILDDKAFERLIFDLVQSAEGYENTDWFMHTNAPDRGRDIQTYRVRVDPLSMTQRQRVIVQCKHWLSKSVSVSDIRNCLDAVSLWEPPKVDVLVIATTGRITPDAVQWKERRDQDRSVPAVELWPDSHVETLVAARHGLAARFGLR